MSKIGLVLLVVLMAACGQKDSEFTSNDTAAAAGATGPKGDPGLAGPPGMNGVAGLDAFKRVEFARELASESYTLAPGVYHLPTALTVREGHFGSGWASIQIGNVLYCYRGDIQHDCDETDRLTFRGVTTEDRCRADRLLPTLPDFTLAVKTGIAVSLHGSARTDAKIVGREFNY